MVSNIETTLLLFAIRDSGVTGNYKNLCILTFFTTLVVKSFLASKAHKAFVSVMHLGVAKIFSFSRILRILTYTLLPSSSLFSSLTTGVSPVSYMLR